MRGFDASHMSFDEMRDPPEEGLRERLYDLWRGFPKPVFQVSSIQLWWRAMRMTAEDHTHDHGGQMYMLNWGPLMIVWGRDG